MAKHILSMFLLLLFVSPAQADLDNFAPITIDNVSHLESLGYFTPVSEEDVLRLDWLPGSDDIFVVYGSYYDSQGVWLYDATQLDAEPFFLEGQAAFSRDGNLYILRSLTLQRLVTERLEVEPGTLLEKLPPGTVLVMNRFGGPIFSPDGTLVAAHGAENKIVVWDVLTGEQAFSDTAGGYGVNVSSMNFNADGTLIVAATDYGWVGVWDIATGELIAERRDHFNVARASFSPIENLVLTESVDRSVTLWDAENSDDYQFIDAHTDVVYAFFTPDGSRLIVADAFFFEFSHNRLEIWDVEERTRIAEHDLEDMSIYDRITGNTSLSPSGDVLAFWTRNPNILLIDPISGEQLHSLEGGAAWVTGAAFNSDGSLFVSWDEANELRFWDVATGYNLATFETGPIVDLIFSHDGTRLISAHTDGTIQLWGISG